MRALLLILNKTTISGVSPLPSGLEAPGLHTKPHLQSFSLLPGQKAAWGGFFLATKSWDPPKPTGALRSSDPRRICSAGLEAAVPAEVSQPPHALAPGPVPSFASAQTHPCASVSHPVSVSSGQTIEFQGKIHPLLMCRGRSWHKQGCDQNYSPKVQP